MCTENVVKTCVILTPLTSRQPPSTPQVITLALLSSMSSGCNPCRHWPVTSSRLALPYLPLAPVVPTLIEGATPHPPCSDLLSEWQASGDVASALVLYGEAVELAPGNTEAMCSYGVLLKEMSVTVAEQTPEARQTLASVHPRAATLTAHLHLFPSFAHAHAHAHAATTALPPSLRTPRRALGPVQVGGEAGAIEAGIESAAPEAGREGDKDSQRRASGPRELADCACSAHGPH